jgi:hypothetical protein
MRDDIAPINIGQAGTNYDKKFFWEAFRAIEQFHSRLLAVGLVRVSHLTAGSIEVGGVSIPDLRGTTLTDGVTEPATVAGKAQIYIDIADGDLKIKFGDGTIKTIVTDT